MATPSKVRKTFDKRLEKAGQYWIEKFPGRLGNYAHVVAVPGKQGVVYVRLETSGQVVEAVNTLAPGIFDFPVFVGRDKSQPKVLKVSEIRWIYALGTMINYIVFHHRQHEYPNPDTVWIMRDQFMPLLVLPTGGFNVKLFGDVIPTSPPLRVPDQVLDLSAYVNSTDANYLRLEIASDGTVNYVVGEHYADLAILRLTAPIPTPTEGSTPVCAIEFYTGQTEIRRDSTERNIIDLRMFTSNVVPTTGTQINTADTDTPEDGDLFGFWDIIDGTLKSVSFGGLKDALGGVTEFPVEFRIDGKLASLAGVAGRHIANGKQTIKYVYISCDDPGAAGNTVVDVNRNGTSIFVTQANRPTLAYNDSDGVAKSGIPDVIYLDETDVLTVDIDGTATGADGLSVDVYLQSGEDERHMTYPRTVLIDDIWSGNGLPATGADSITTNVSSPLTSQPSNLLRVDRLSIVMDDNDGTPVMTAQPWVFYPTTGTSINKLALVHQGHVNSLDQIGVGDTIRALVEDGFTVVGFLMPADGDVPTHESYPTPTGTLNYLKFFLEPIVRTINELASSFEAVYMTGLSGGGWTTHLAAAVDARISVSVPVSGALAFSSPPTLGGSGAYRDWEQDLPGITAVSDYPDLMVMAADKPGRSQVQIIRAVDDVVYGEVEYNAGYQYDADVTAAAAVLGGSYDLVIDSTGTAHVINAYDIAQIETAFGVP